MVSQARKSLQDGEGSSTLRFPTTVTEGQNNWHFVHEEVRSSDQCGPGGNSDQGVVSAAAAAKALGKRKLEDIIDEQITDEQLEATQIEANQGEGSSQKKRCMISPAKHESKIDKALTCYNMEAIVELVRLATEELRVMAVVTEPLWKHCSADDGGRILDKVEYRRIFPNLIGPTPVGFASEASRETGRVKLSPNHLISILMDATKWSAIFYEIVAKARTIDVLVNPGGATDYDGTLQVMTARYQLPTPVVPNRETYFARFCKKYSENDWIVVDVSLDSVHQVPVMGCKKRPSGCLIHRLSDGFSQIAWLEHVDADHRGVSTMCQSLLVSGIGFGAKRWMSTLERRCQQMGTDISLRAPIRDYNQLVMSSDKKGWTVLSKLAARMVFNFNSGISGITGNWKKLSQDSTDSIRVLIRRNVKDASLPTGTLISAAASIWLPVPPKSVFDFLRDHNSASEPLIPYSTGREARVRTNGNANIEQVCHISKGQEASYCVSIHKFLTENILLLQETSSDPVASYIVYARLGTEDFNLIRTGSSPHYRPLLPSGFIVHPDGPAVGTEGSRGSLLTISFQLLVDSSPTLELPDGMQFEVTNMVNSSIERIKIALEEFASQAAIFASMNRT